MDRQEYARRWSSVYVRDDDFRRISIPEDIERRAESFPCSYCATRGPCKHRPWMQRAA